VTDLNLWALEGPSGATIWGYGRYGDDQILPLSFDDVRHDAAAATSALLALGLPEGSVIVLTSTVADTGHFHPVQTAAKELDLMVCNADASAMDVDRVEMFLRLLPVAAVIGVTSPVVDGILERGHDPQAVFGATSVVVADGPAQQRLADAGVDALRFEILGPVLAFSCRQRNLHYDGRHWRVDRVDGMLHVSSRGRALVLSDFDTGVEGSVSEAVCTCGRRDPMIRIEGSAGTGEQS
jgi:hypothetical protein